MINILVRKKDTMQYLNYFQATSMDIKITGRAKKKNHNHDVFKSQG